MYILPIDEHDLPVLLLVYQQCEDFLALGPIALASSEMVLADLAHTRQIGGVFCGIFLEKGQLVGVLSYVANGYEGNPQIAFLELLMIASPFRGLGLGKTAVEWVESVARQAGARQMRSGVQVNNPRARRFWKRCGYSEVGKPQLLPDGTTAVRMTKGL